MNAPYFSANHLFRRTSFFDDDDALLLRAFLQAPATEVVGGLGAVVVSLEGTADACSGVLDHIGRVEVLRTACVADAAVGLDADASVTCDLQGASRHVEVA